MDIYEKVLMRLLSGSTKLKKLPDPDVLKPPLILVYKGFKHYLVDPDLFKNLGIVSSQEGDEKLFLVQDPDGNLQEYTYEELSEKFEGE